MNKPKLSVVVPAYNVELWIADCLESIICQSYRNLEIIVINDGSTDETGSIIEGYAKKDNRIIPVHQKNKGLVMSREVGISLATAKYTTFVDADDTINQDMYERLMNNIIKYEADISHCGVNFCYADNKINSHYGTGLIKIQNTFEGIKDLLEGKIVEPALWNKIYKTELLYNSCLDLDILNNEDLLRNFVVFSRADKSIFEDFCGYNYFQREGSMSNNINNQVSIYKHVFNARKLIVENSNKNIYPYAMKLWLSCSINIINTFNLKKDEKSIEFLNEQIYFLKSHRNDFHFLSRKQQLAANLVIRYPIIHKFIYKIYRKFR